MLTPRRKEAKARRVNTFSFFASRHLCDFVLISLGDRPGLRKKSTANGVWRDKGLEKGEVDCEGGKLDSLSRTWKVMAVTLTLELSELRSANEKAIAQLSRTSQEKFDTELKEIENFLLSLYRFAVLAVKTEQHIQRAAEIWRETLDVIDSAARQVQGLAARYPGVHPSLDHILGIRHAASEMLALYT